MNRAVLHDNKQKCWLHFQSPIEVVEARDMGEVLPALARVELAVERDQYFTAGFVSYHAAPAFDPALQVRQNKEIPLLRFYIYESCKRKPIPQPDAVDWNLDWKPSISYTEYLKALDTIKKHIQAGNTYQTNFTLRLNTPFPYDLWNAFLRLVSAQSPNYAGYLESEDWVICSASPELFFRLDGERIESHPMKGTAARGLTSQQDLSQAASLQACPKNRAENLMIVDMVRNDLGRIARCGSVEVPELFKIEKYPTVWQMVSKVRAQTQASIPEIFTSLFPPASITGAPKPRTMEIIRQMESTPRRVYTGAVGFLLPGRQVQFNVAIRTLLVDRKQGTAEYGVGGGIVWDSVSDLEWQECETKARVLFQAGEDFSILETMLWIPDQGFFLLDRHLDRMKNSADYFDFKFDEKSIQEELERLVKNLPDKNHRVRLLLAKDGEIECQATLIAESNLSAKKRVCLAQECIDSQNPFLYHKTTRRDVYKQSLEACPGFEDVILFNEKDEITESTIANVAVEIDGELYTPPIECGLLAGTMRDQLLEEGQIRERIVSKSELLASPRILLMNSVRGMNEVEIVDER